MRRSSREAQEIRPGVGVPAGTSAPPPANTVGPDERGSDRSGEVAPEPFARPGSPGEADGLDDEAAIGALRRWPTRGASRASGGELGDRLADPLEATVGGGRPGARTVFYPGRHFGDGPSAFTQPSRPAGTTKWKVLPSPTALSTHILPPCASTMDFEMCSPMPRPRGSL